MPRSKSCWNLIAVDPNEASEKGYSQRGRNARPAKTSVEMMIQLALGYSPVGEIRVHHAVAVVSRGDRGHYVVRCSSFSASKRLRVVRS